MSESIQHVILDHEPLTYHVLSPDHRSRTCCGIRLAGEDYSKGSDPGDMLDICMKCAVKGPVKVSRKQIIEWLSEKADFEYTGQSYLDSEDLQAIVDGWLELEGKLKKLRKSVDKQETDNGDREWTVNSVSCSNCGKMYPKSYTRCPDCGSPNTAPK